MIPIATSDEYLSRMLDVPRPGGDSVLAFYEHRLGMICRDPKLMLAPLDDHLTHRGDGVFETIKYTGGRLYLLDEHLARLKRSAAGLSLEPPCSWEELRQIIIETAAAGKEPVGMMRVLVGRGPGGFGIDPSECPVSSLYIAAYRFTEKTPAWYAQGQTGFRSSVPAKQGYLARIKNANYLPNVLMIMEAHEKGADVPFCFDDENNLTESSVANLCIVDSRGVIVIPELNNALAGTTLLRGLELVRDELAAETRPIREEDILNAKEVLLLGTGPECVAIVSYNGQKIGDGKPGPVSKLLLERIDNDIAASGTPIPGLS